MLSLGFSPLGRRTAVVAGVIISAVACSDDATAPQHAPRVPPAISAVDNPDLGRLISLPPAVDGVIKPGEYDSGVSFSFLATVPSGLLNIATPVTVHVTRDQTYLYFAATFDRKSPFRPGDMVSFEFDKDNDGVREDGDDVLWVRSNIVPNVAYAGADFYRYSFNNNWYNKGDNADGGTIDALSAWGAVGTTGVFEIRQPLNSSDDAHDFSINPTLGAQTIGMQTMVKLEAGAIGSGTFVTTYNPSLTTYCTLSVGNKKVTGVTCP